MALTPAQMGDAILRNLEAKTGRPLDHWLDVLHELDAPDAKTAKAGLKAAGLGHFQAQKVYEVSRGEDPYGDPDALLAALFPAGTAARAAFGAFAKTCHDLGDDVQLRPCRTYAPFYAATQFAIAQPDPSAGGALRVGLALPEGAVSDEFGTSGRRGGSVRINTWFDLPTSTELTAAQRRVLAEAYAHNR